LADLIPYWAIKRSRFCLRKSAVASSTVRLRGPALAGGWGASSAPMAAAHSRPIPIATPQNQTRNRVSPVFEKPIMRLLQTIANSRLSGREWLETIAHTRPLRGVKIRCGKRSAVDREAYRDE